MHCNRKYIPEPKAQGHPESMRKRAMELYVDGNNLRRIARHLKVAPQTVAFWVTDLAEALSNEVREAEMDAMFTFIGDKNEIYILTLVDRKTCCIMSWPWFEFAGRRHFNKLSIKLQKRNGSTLTVLKQNNGSGMTLADTKLSKASPTRIRSKRTMQSCVNIWHVSWFCSLPLCSRMWPAFDGLLFH